MTEKTAVTTKNFSSKLSAWKRSATSMRGNAQEILDFGFTAYVEHGDAGYLSRMYTAASEIRGINAGRMFRYIVAHANVRWNEEKSSFAKSSKKDAASVEPRAVPWYEFEKPVAEARALDINKRIDSLIKQIGEAEKVKLSPKEAHELVSKLDALISKLEETSEEQAA